MQKRRLPSFLGTSMIRLAHGLTEGCLYLASLWPSVVSLLCVSWLLAPDPLSQSCDTLYICAPKLWIAKSKNISLPLQHIFQHFCFTSIKLSGNSNKLQNSQTCHSTHQHKHTYCWLRHPSSLQALGHPVQKAHTDSNWTPSSSHTEILWKFRTGINALPPCLTLIRDSWVHIPILPMLCAQDQEFSTAPTFWPGIITDCTSLTWAICSTTAYNGHPLAILTVIPKKGITFILMRQRCSFTGCMNVGTLTLRPSQL